MSSLVQQVSLSLADHSVTDFHKNHPGGATVIVANAGRDVTYVLLSI